MARAPSAELAMNRRTVHALFGVALLACGLLAVVSGVQYAQAVRTNERVARVLAGDEPIDAGVTGDVAYAGALTLARAGRYEQALDAYKALIHGRREDLRRAALYNVGNLHLREALRVDPSDRMRALALVELAKQAYRDLLRQDPDDWDARYNLERALWLAPEADDAEEDPVQPLQSERAPTTMKSERGALP
jgi:mxaK protein